MTEHTGIDSEDKDSEFDFGEGDTAYDGVPQEKVDHEEELVDVLDKWTDPPRGEGTESYRQLYRRKVAMLVDELNRTDMEDGRTT